MMKYMISMSLLFLTACASPSRNITTSNLTYEKVLNFKIGATSETEVIKLLGTPSSRAERTDYHVLVYNDPQTGFQRLSLNFNNSTKLLTTLLWVPADGEKEISLGGAKEGFNGVSFKQVDEDTSSPHAISKIILFVDEKSGVTIRYNPTVKVVEAIAKYDIGTRSPSNIDKTIKTPYTFGDESASTK